MKLWHYKSSLIVIVAAALLGLVLLASLQYHWVGQLSRAEQERMQANLRAGALRFSEDFDRELARAYLSFQMDAVTLRDRDWQRYLARYAHWNNTAPYPQLVETVYLVSADENSQFNLERLDLATGQFTPSAWPAELHKLRAGFLETSADLRSQDEVSSDHFADPVASEIPALVIPLSRSWLLLDRQEYLLADVLFSNTMLTPPRRGCLYCRPSRQSPLLFAHTIVVLNRHYIEQEFIPTLARRYFSGDNGLDYGLHIVDHKDPHRTIYQSNSQLSGDRGAADATMELMGIQFENLNRLLLDDAFQLANLSTDDPLAPRVAIGILGQPQPAALRPDAPSEGSIGHWQLTLTHRAGSLEQVVDQVRMRNLLISFSTVLLLGTSLLILIVATQRAQHLAQQKIEFVAAISHELRTPLAVIRSAGENLADGVINQPQQARRYGALIRDEGRRLTDLVEQALELAGAQSGRKTYELRPIQVEWLLDTALAACKTQPQADGFVVERDIPQDLPPVLGDAAALVRTVQNLLSNAMKYGGDDRWIGVSAHTTNQDRQPAILLTIMDHGRGIAPADLQRIFDPFYRGSEVVAEQIHGSGIGLSVVKQVIEAHHGHITVDSVPGQGSTFTLCVPAAPDELPSEQPQHGRLRMTLGRFLRNLWGQPS